MKFKEVFQYMKKGDRIKRKHWGGYWHIENGEIIINTKDGSIINIRDSENIVESIDNMTFDDWEVDKCEENDYK